MDEADIVTAISASTIVLILTNRQRRKKHKMRLWVKDWIRERANLGAFHSLLGELEQTDLSSYRNFMRMDSTSFEELLSKVTNIRCSNWQMIELRSL